MYRCRSYPLSAAPAHRPAALAGDQVPAGRTAPEPHAATSAANPRRRRSAPASGQGTPPPTTPVQGFRGTRRRLPTSGLGDAAVGRVQDSRGSLRCPFYTQCGSLSRLFSCLHLRTIVLLLSSTAVAVCCELQYVIDNRIRDYVYAVCLMP